MNGVERIAAERKRQIEGEGWTAEHDSEHDEDDIALAAVSYALPSGWRYSSGNALVPRHWPWSQEWWKPTPDDRIRELEKAGALIAAEIDRLLAQGGTPE